MFCSFLQDVPGKKPRCEYSSDSCPGSQPAAVCAAGTSARPQCAPHSGSSLQTGGKTKPT